MEDEKCSHGFYYPCYYCEDGQSVDEKLALIEHAIQDKRLLQFDYVFSAYHVHYCIQIIPEEITDTLYLVGHNVKDEEYGRYDIRSIRLLEIISLDL